jgi:hypothetical protein
MRSLIVALIALPFVIAVTSKSVAVECSIRDSAVCLSNPKCHWDYSKRGCEPGPAPDQDGCVAHEAKETCNTDDSLGCKWSEEANKCQSAKK